MKPITALTLIAAALLMTACGGGESSTPEPAPVAVEAPAPAPAPKQIVIEMYGDSTTQGYADASEPLFLQALVPSNVRVINEGVNGSNASGLLYGRDGRHLPWVQQMANSHADIVTLNFALNDTVSTSLQLFYQDLGALIEIAQKAGKRVVLQEPNPTCFDKRSDILPDFVAAIDMLAGERGAQLVKQYTLLPDWKANMKDCLHPDAPYYAVKARNTYAVIKPLIGE